MILIEVKPRQDNLFDIYVGDEGDHFVNSDQGYENVEDAESIVRRLWPPVQLPVGDGLEWSADIDGTLTRILDDYLRAAVQLVAANTEKVVLRVTYRDGKTKTEQLR